MSWFSKLLGTDKALDVVKDSAKSTFSIIDEAFHTDQEKAEGKLKAANIWLESQRTIAKQSAPTAISRRVIAWAIIGLVVFFCVQGSLYIALEQTEKLTDLLKFIKAMWIGEAFTAVMVFYFGAHLLGGKK